MQLTLIRGASGSGKSTIANHLAEPFHPVFEADDFFTFNGLYKYDVELLHKAHLYTQLRVERLMHLERPEIFVANTFIKQKDMAKYFGLAFKYHYEIKIWRTPGPWIAEDLFKRNKHDVPLHVVERHITNYQAHSAEIEWTDLTIF